MFHEYHHPPMTKNLTIHELAHALFEYKIKRYQYYRAFSKNYISA